MSSALTIEIKPKKSYLRPSELIADRHAEVESPRIGLKRTKAEGSEEEQQELNNAYANFRRQLSKRRIDRQSGRAIATWRDGQQAAEVLKKDGKFESFGYNLHGKLFLEYYEALFLMELNRLQLEYCEKIVSVEQAYVLLLGEAASEKFNHYLVYSTLTRAGYIVVKHQDMKETPQCSASNLVTNEDCIWALLDESLGLRSVPHHIKDSAVYDVVHTRMSNLKKQIMNQTYESSDEPYDFKFDTRKRKADPEPRDEVASKRVYTVRASRSLVDQLQDEAQYSKFKKVFDKLDVVQLDSSSINLSNDRNAALREFKIIFDLYRHNEGFRRSTPKAPSLSVIILPPDEPFLTHDEMLNYHRQQPAHEAPLLVISVSESKQIQAFLYYIS